MSGTTRQSALRWGGLVATFTILVGVCGCTISFHPGAAFSFPGHQAPAAPAPPMPPLDPALVPLGKPGYPPGAAAALPPGDYSAMMRQRMVAQDEERKVLLDRIQEMEAQLQDKNQAVRQANYEIQDSIKQIRKTREDITRWKQEMDDLRSKVRSMETENKATLETIVKTLERYLEPPVR